MNHAAVIARLVAAAVSHELANQMQPLVTAVRVARTAEPEQLGSLLDLANDAVLSTLVLAEQLRLASAAPSKPQSVRLDDALERAAEQVFASGESPLRSSEPGLESVVADPMLLEVALARLLAHVTRAGGAGAPILVGGGAPGGPALLLRFGGASPSRDDAAAARPLTDHALGELRLTPDLALAGVICASLFGEGALRVAHGDRSGRMELWIEAST